MTIKPTLFITAQYLKQSFRSWINLLFTAFVMPVLGVFIIFLAYHPAVHPNDREPAFFFCIILTFWLAANSSCISLITDRERYIRDRLKGFSIQRYYFGMLSGHFVLSCITSIITVIAFVLLQRTPIITVMSQWALCTDAAYSSNAAFLEWKLYAALLAAVLISSISGTLIGLAISATSRTERQALMAVPVITVFFIVFSPQVAGKRPAQDALRRAYKPLVEIIGESKFDSISAITLAADTHKALHEKYGYGRNGLRGTASRTWGAFLGFLNPLRYAYNATSIPDEPSFYKGFKARVKSFWIELIPVFTMWVICILHSFIFLNDPRSRQET